MKVTRYGQWKIWNGGECPCPGKLVQVQTSDEERQEALKYPNTGPADLYRWDHRGQHDDIIAYREVIEPVREAVLLTGCKHWEWDFGVKRSYQDTHSITFDLIDGEPDCDSIKMEKLK